MSTVDRRRFNLLLANLTGHPAAVVALLFQEATGFHLRHPVDL